ncbi:RING/FYVE/PHD ZINC FINGER SUPERFAMILY PROTEIN [Salix purpurea]|uniref:RING/FYVE/PHD ZINC FINGER SUPERFAMILY PROTEIN n=1 Tax=Salix purpurea TaxID=77065 RepID=A0A9Q0T432_SALPP|nr:RING/FYVE/PHD ZINC FINGER SUPERFAMILY PROTEIN [Salix purpurea]
MGKKTSQGGLEENRPVENGHDECVGMDRQGQCLDPDNAFQHNQHEIAHNANKMPQDISGDRLHPYSLVHEINCAEARISNNAPSVGTPKKIFVNENEDNSDHSGQLKPSNSLCHPDAAVRTNLISNGEKVGEEVVRENSSGTGLDRNQHEVCADPNDSDADQLCKEKDVFSESQRKDGQRQKAVCFTNIDEGETSDDENDKSSTSNYFIRFRNIEKQHRYPIMPQLRRKKVSWTVQEEEMLKEGVQKFSSDGKFPWKDILEYGSSVFLNGRTTIDLKDKWRNMCKVSPKSK